MSCTVRTPPPTVSGMNTWLAMRSTVCRVVSRPSDAGGDVEEGDLVGALLVVAAGDLHRVTGVADVLELDALDHAAVVHVQTRNDAFGQRHLGSPQPLKVSQKAWASATSRVPS